MVEFRNQTCRKILTEGGSSASGSQATVNPQTGRIFQEPVFIGPVYYQRLRHMVMDKVYERTTGWTEAQTRQPLKGRMKGGGLRFG